MTPADCCPRCARTLRLGLCPVCDGEAKIHAANRQLDAEIRAAVEAEREACAKLADDFECTESHRGMGETWPCCRQGSEMATAIRARGGA